MDKEQIMIDGVNVGGCKYLNTFSDCDGYHYYCDLADDIKNEYCEYYKDCYFKQLARKTQECEELISEKDFYLQKIEVLDQECEELKKQLETSEEWRIKAEGLNEKLELKNTRYRKALEEIEKIAQNGLRPICYKSNCSCCRCYDGDDCNTSMTSLINNYFTENGEFVDESGDFVEALEGLLESERKKCNKAQPIAQRILDIINKAKGEEDKQ